MADGCLDYVALRFSAKLALSHQLQCVTTRRSDKSIIDVEAMIVEARKDFYTWLYHHKISMTVVSLW